MSIHVYRTPRRGGEKEVTAVERREGKGQGVSEQDGGTPEKSIEKGMARHRRCTGGPDCGRRHRFDAEQAGLRRAGHPGE